MDPCLVEAYDQIEMEAYGKATKYKKTMPLLVEVERLRRDAVAITDHTTSQVTTTLKATYNKCLTSLLTGEPCSILSHVLKDNSLETRLAFLRHLGTYSEMPRPIVNGEVMYNAAGDQWCKVFMYRDGEATSGCHTHLSSSTFSVFTSASDFHASPENHKVLYDEGKGEVVAFCDHSQYAPLLEVKIEGGKAEECNTTPHSIQNHFIYLKNTEDGKFNTRVWFSTPDACQAQTVILDIPTHLIKSDDATAIETYSMIAMLSLPSMSHNVITLLDERLYSCRLFKKMFFEFKRVVLSADVNLRCELPPLALNFLRWTTEQESVIQHMLLVAQTCNHDPADPTLQAFVHQLAQLQALIQPSTAAHALCNVSVAPHATYTRLPHTPTKHLPDAAPAPANHMPRPSASSPSCPKRGKGRPPRSPKSKPSASSGGFKFVSENRSTKMRVVATNMGIRLKPTGKGRMTCLEMKTIMKQCGIRDLEPNAHTLKDAERLFRNAASRTVGQ